jgi:anti-sigma factor RsiW
MRIPDFDDVTPGPDEAELELLAEYLDGRMSDRDEEAFESRLVADAAFRGRMLPIIRDCYKGEPVPIEIEIGIRLADRGLIRRPRVERPPRRKNRWRRRQRWQRYKP